MPQRVSWNGKRQGCRRTRLSGNANKFALDWQARWQDRKSAQGEVVCRGPRLINQCDYFHAMVLQSINKWLREAPGPHPAPEPMGDRVPWLPQAEQLWVSFRVVLLALLQAWHARLAEWSKFFGCTTVLHWSKQQEPTFRIL